ncbi:DUF4291 domain-containing protein [Nocardia aurantia]|uniref:DUF4291 domain-containing protein n=1 Tax=Nocardia aurantia TaxID=2585199 RepID=A0A7K0DHA9_9NOCA|nr:DUF4291 domain-containing protein [Nocardia aurantia]MQY25037.1 hypothetical protein [Nocardia aurantia]
MKTPFRQIRARFDDRTVTVYQAFSPDIAGPAVKDGRFSSGFKRDRMTWIKPSFLWMMYRSGWGTKPGQERVLAVTMSRAGFEWALQNSTFSHFEPEMHESRERWKASLTAPVRIQWDPERDMYLAPLSYRSIQIGLSGRASRLYCDEWTTAIEDVTDLAHEVHQLVLAEDIDRARALLPVEQPYQLAQELATHLGVK